MGRLGFGTKRAAKGQMETEGGKIPEDADVCEFLNEGFHFFWKQVSRENISGILVRSKDSRET